MGRKSPIRHNVRASSRKGRSVTSFDRGSGNRSSNPHTSKYVPPELRSFAESNQNELRKFSRDGLAKFFDQVGCQAIAREIRADRDVTGNVEFGLNACVHSKTGAKVNALTREFIPQSKKAQDIEDRILTRVNGLLANGGYRTIDENKLKEKWRKRDMTFKKEIQGMDRKLLKSLAK